MAKILITNAIIVNEGKKQAGNVLINGETIENIVYDESITTTTSEVDIIDASGKYLIPGIIDDQVHFREPGLIEKEDIYSGSKAAVAGGVTSYMEMPNTKPQSITHKNLEQKYQLAAEKSLANYSFYLGATNNNISEIEKTDPANVCGIKVFMGASTGNMLVDNQDSLNKIFKYSPVLIATHCEDESTIKNNLNKYNSEFKNKIPIEYHPLVRNEEACYRSSSLAAELATKYNSKLHVLHISTAKELELFTNAIPLNEKKITAEVCVHHLWFSDQDYKNLGSKIKWNPAIKTIKDKEKLLEGLVNNKIDVVATDHAPHTAEEKQIGIPNDEFNYATCPSGGPLIQHSLAIMLKLYKQGKISLEHIINKMCHAPADLFRIKNRGYIRKGYYADLAIVDLNNSWTVDKSNILYKCGWSPLEGQNLSSIVTHTIINGNLVYNNGVFFENIKGKRLEFNR